MDATSAGNLNRLSYNLKNYLKQNNECLYNISSKNCILISQKDINNGAYTITKPGYYKLVEDIIHEFFKEDDNENNTTRQLRNMQRCIRITKSTYHKIKVNMKIYEKKPIDFFSQSNHRHKLNNTLRWYEKDGKIYIEDNKILIRGLCFSLDPNALNSCYIDSNENFSVINPHYIGGANVKEATAAIKIACDNVIIDFNGHSITQGKRFYCEQRVYSIIEINKFVFTNSGADFEPGPRIEQFGCTNIAILNGSIGTSSHFGIHGTNTSQLICKNLNIHDFNVAGIWINDGHQIIIEDCNIHGLINNHMPILELRAFKTLGTGKNGIVDSNVWGIFLNDKAGQVQRMFAQESHPILKDESPRDGVDSVDGSTGKNRMLVGPRGCIIRNCNIGEVKSNMHQARVISRKDCRGKIVPILFSVKDNGHNGLKACDEMIHESMIDGFANYKNHFNVNYTEIFNSYVITSNNAMDTDGYPVTTTLEDTLIIGKLYVFKKVNDMQILQGGNNSVGVDKFTISPNGYMHLCKLANDDTKYDIIIPPENYYKLNDETLISPRWNFELDSTTSRMGLVFDNENLPKFIDLNRKWSLQTEIVDLKNVENRYKIASKCLKKSLIKSDYGKFPQLYIPTNDESDLINRANCTFFKFQYDIEVDEHSHFDKKQTFIWVEDNYGIDNWKEHLNNKNHKLKVVHFDHDCQPMNVGSINSFGEPFSPYPGSYVTIRQGNFKGHAAKKIPGKCTIMDHRLRTLSAKEVEVILLTNEMLAGRCKKRECGGIDTDRKNGIDAGGHNMIGSFGIMLERAWGGLFDKIEISGSMVLNAEGRWGANWWGFMANNSGFNTFHNIKIRNLPGNPGTVFGFHLQNGSNSNECKNINVQGANSTGEAYGITVDKASESNSFTDCFVSEIIATEAALGYVIRGRNNRFECCKASRIILLLDENAEHAGDMMAAGFCLDADDEEFASIPGYNILYECHADNIRTMMDKELNMERVAISENRVNHSTSGKNRDMIKAGKPQLLTTTALLTTLAAGVVIVHQENNNIEKCKVDNVSSWGIAAGILLSEHLSPNTHPCSNVKNRATYNNISNIVSYNPGCVIIDSDIKVKINLLEHGVLHTIWVNEKKMLNPLHHNFQEEVQNNKDFLKQLLKPSVYGIGDLRMCGRNNFTPFFENQETQLSVKSEISQFVSDTICIGNTVTNCYNYWTNIHNSYEFNYLNIPESGCLTNEVKQLLHKMSKDMIHSNEIDQLTNNLRKEKNIGLYWSNDINLDDAYKIRDIDSKINISYTNTHQQLHKDGLFTLDSRALNFLTIEQYNLIMEQQLSVLSKLKKPSSDSHNLFVTLKRLPNTHEENEAHALLEEIEAGNFDENHHVCEHEEIEDNEMLNFEF